MESELEALKKVKRPQVIERIKRAKDYGDLSENAEYEDARNEQSFVEGRIKEVEYVLKNAVLVQNGKSKGEISLGSVATVKLDGEKLTYELVGSNEVDPMAGKISNESPIGRALMGRKVGDKVTASTPGGALDIEILKVE